MLPLRSISTSFDHRPPDGQRTPADQPITAPVGEPRILGKAEWIADPDDTTTGRWIATRLDPDPDGSIIPSPLGILSRSGAPQDLISRRLGNALADCDLTVDRAAWDDTPRGALPRVLIAYGTDTRAEPTPRAVPADPWRVVIRTTSGAHWATPAEAIPALPGLNLDDGPDLEVAVIRGHDPLISLGDDTLNDDVLVMYHARIWSVLDHEIEDMYGRAALIADAVNAHPNGGVR
jgi:hypothetical protein